ncbi:DUF2378 family protein [Myxococcota bacterium]|nr:DUF2378 family protein [Myxococcota bacterium]
MSNFIEINWKAPLELEKRMAGIDKDSTVKGMFVNGIYKQASKKVGKDIADKNYVAFKDYPLGDLLMACVNGAKEAYPALPPREGIRNLGHSAYYAFSGSTIGKVVLSSGSNKWEKVIRLAPKAFSLSTKATKIQVLEQSESEVILSVRHSWAFPDAYHVGIFEAAMEDCGVKGHVKVKYIDFSNLDMQITW